MMQLGRDDDASRFWSHVVRGDSDACWLWNGRVNRNRDGYGVLDGYSDGKKQPLWAHRVSWELHHGTIPRGLCVCHSCDTPPCVNPAHLFLGTNAENMKDCRIKGRQQHGSRHSHAKLSAEEVATVITMALAGIRYREIGQLFGISQSHVCGLYRGRFWGGYRRGDQLRYPERER